MAASRGLPGRALAIRTIPERTTSGNIAACSQPRNFGLSAATTAAACSWCGGQASAMPGPGASVGSAGSSRRPATEFSRFAGDGCFLTLPILTYVSVSYAVVGAEDPGHRGTFA